MPEITLTLFEATLILPVQLPAELPTAYVVKAPPMPPRRAVTIEEFEADMRAAGVRRG